jgi:hypothetical protein
LRRKSRAILVTGVLSAMLVGAGVGRVWSALTYKQESLARLKRVYVLVEGVDADAEKLGLSEEQLKTVIELRLREAGIGLLTREQSFQEPGTPIVYLNVCAQPGAESRTGYFFMSLQVRQEASLTRDPEIATFASTWNDGMLCRGDRSMAQEALDGMLKAFLNDYLAANPKNYS